MMMQPTQPPPPPPPPSKVYVSFSAEVNANTTESLITVMANCVNQKVSEVELLISSPGGSVMNGINVYNVLRAMPLKLITHNVGNVDSIANVIFLAGEVRYACPQSTFMFHGVSRNAGLGERLEVKSLREALDSIETDNARIGAVIQERTQIGQPEVTELFREAQTKDAAWAAAKGIVHDIREAKIPPGSTVVALVFQR